MLIFTILFQALEPNDIASTIINVLSTPSVVQVCMALCTMVQVLSANCVIIYIGT